MGPEILSSNVLNYLIWRYLQEAGYGNAALQLSRAWHRHPDSLPFSQRVTAHALINIVQDGLFLDCLRADADRSSTRYGFGPDHGPRFSIGEKPVSDAEEEEPDDRMHDVNGREAIATDSTADIAAPKTTKRKRKSNGTDRRRNVDAMEIDTNGHVPEAEAEAVVSDVESPTEEIQRLSTLEIGESKALQSEKIANLSPNTTVIKIDKPDVSINHAVWIPQSVPILLAAGENVLRFHVVPGGDTADGPIVHQDASISSERLTVTAVCLISPDEIIFAGLEQSTNDQGEILEIGKLFELRNGGFDLRVISSIVDTVFALRWNPTSKLLLSISSTDINGVIRIWQDHSGSTPLFSVTTDTAIVDAAWTSDSEFLVTGHAFLQTYTITPTNLKPQQNFPASFKWEKLLYDPASNTAACASLEDNELGILDLSASSPALRTLNFGDRALTALQFQPLPTSAPNPLTALAPTPPTNPTTISSDDPAMSRLLATADSSGTITLYNARTPFQTMRHLHMTRPALALAFSPDGALLAAAGAGHVIVWDVELGGPPRGVWRGDEAGEGDGEGATGEEEEGEEGLGEKDVLLSWEPEGGRVAYVVRREIALIEYRR